MKICVFPGSFDPITRGHVDLVKRALPLFDKIVIATGINTSKQSLIPLDKRLQWIDRCFQGESKVSTNSYQGLTVDFCQSIEAGFLLRGLRNASDFDYEKTISQMNHIIGKGIETVFLISQPEFSHISSTIVREIIKGGADVSPFVPEEIQAEIYDFFRNQGSNK
ncbi:MAG: pantetheine-phosphate adenylyltransferase [Saprospiraceae bacterium]